MSRKLIGLIALSTLALLMAACTRSASTAPLPTPTIEGFPLAEATPTGMGLIEQLATQTAMAALLNPESTPTPDGTTEASVDGTPTESIVLPTLPGDTTAQPGDSTALPSPTPDASQPTTAAAVAGTPAPTLVIGIPASGTYTLQAGEFPYCIARRFNLDPDELLALNGLSKSQTYYTPGTVLKLPSSGKPFPGSRALLSHPASHVVSSGETIYSISCKYGDVDPANIAANNGLSAPYTLTVGQTLQIP